MKLSQLTSTLSFTSAAARTAPLLGALLSGASGACTTSFEPVSTVSDVRVLAVRGTPSYALPGESVELKALAVDPRNRTLSFAWTTCVNPAASVVGACLAKIAEDARAGRPPRITTGEGLTDYTLTVPNDALAVLPEVARAQAMIGVISVTCPGTIAFADAANQRADELPVRCIDDLGQSLPPEGFVVSMKRIGIRSRDRNADPGIAAITWNGEPWPENEVRQVSACENDPTLYADCQGGEQPLIAVESAADAVETGVDERGVAFDEQVIAQHYGTQGVFEFDVRRADSPGTRWAARHGAVGTDQRLWFTLRDDRGGVTWTSRTVQVR